MNSDRGITPDIIREIRGSESQTVFARAVGVSTLVQVSRWETGRATPSPVFRNRLIKLARQRGIAVGATG